MKKLIYTFILISQISFGQDIESIRNDYYQIIDSYDKVDLGFISNLKKSLRRKRNRPYKSEIAYYIAELQRKENDYSGAIEYYNKSLEFHFSDSTIIYCSLGLCYFNLGESSTAIKEYSKATELNPNDGATFFHIGLVYNSIQDYHLAIESFKHSLELGYREDWVYYKLYESVDKTTLTEICKQNIAAYGDNVVSWYFLVKSEINQSPLTSQARLNYEKLRSLDTRGEYFREFEDLFK